MKLAGNVKTFTHKVPFCLICPLLRAKSPVIDLTLNIALILHNSNMEFMTNWIAEVSLTLEVTNDNFHGVHRLELYIVAF